MEYNKNKRPVYLNLVKIRLPIGGIVSILHRITGVLLVLSLAPLFYVLQLSLSSEAGFLRLAAWTQPVAVRALLLLLLLMYLQHIFSGVRHLLLDLDIGVSKTVSRASAWLTLFASLLCIALLGVAVL